MPLMTNQDLIVLTGATRNHLQSIEDALRDVLLANMMTATANQLDTDLIAKATITLLLTLAARESLQIFEANAVKADPEKFGNLAKEALEWAVMRTSPTPAILH